MKKFVTLIALLLVTEGLFSAFFGVTQTIYGNPWDSTVSSHYVSPHENKSGSSANQLTALTTTDWIYKITGPDNSASVQVQNLGDVVYFELDATAPNYVWGNILVLYDKTKLASVSIEEDPNNWYGFWTWWTSATGQAAYGGGGNYYYYDYIAGSIIANQGSQWAQDWVNIYGGGGPVGTIDTNYGSILDPNSADYQALVNKGIGNIPNLGAIRLYTSTYAGGMNNNSPLRLGFQVISTGNTGFNVFSDDATSYNWHSASLPWHLQSNVTLTVAPPPAPPCANMQSDTKTEYGSTVTISGPIEVFTNQPYLINLSAQTDAPVYQWSVTENGVYKDGQGFVWGNQFDKTMMFSQSVVGDYTYTFSYRGIMGAHGWPPFTPVSITVKVIPALPQIENLTSQIDQYYQAGQIKNQGIYNSLLAKLNGWDNATLQGRLGKLNALANQLTALNDNSIDPAAREALLKTIAEMTYYQTLLNGLPTTIDLYLSGEPCSSRAIIDIPGASEFDTTVSGVLRVQLSPTADPNIASFTIITSSYTGTSIIIGGVDFGPLSFCQDPYNQSTGTVNLTTGELTMVENLLVSSPFLTQMGFPHVALQVPQFGTVAIASHSPAALLVFTGGHGTLPAYLPVIGGHNYLLCIAHSTEPPKIKWIASAETPFCWVRITRTDNTVIVHFEATSNTVTCVLTATGTTTTDNGNQITTGFFQGESEGKDGTYVIRHLDLEGNPLPPTPGRFYGKVAVIDITSSKPLLENCHIEWESFVSVTRITKDRTGTVISSTSDTAFRFDGKGWALPTSDPDTWIFYDAPGVFAPEGYKGGPKNGRQDSTYQFKTKIWLVCPGKEPELIGYFEWGYTLTIEFDSEGRVKNSTVTPTPVTGGR